MKSTSKSGFSADKPFLWFLSKPKCYTKIQLLHIGAQQYCPAADLLLTPGLISAFPTYHLQIKDRIALVDD